MTSIEYSNILRQKALNKKVTKKNQTIQKQKEKEDKKDKWIIDSRNANEKQLRSSQRSMHEQISCQLGL